MDNLERVGVEQESVSNLQEAFALLADMVGLAYTKQPSPDAIARFKENADLLRWHCAKLGLVCTPWAHVWSCHLPQFLAHWGTLCPWAIMPG